MKVLLFNKTIINVLANHIPDETYFPDETYCISDLNLGALSHLHVRQSFV